MDTILPVYFNFICPLILGAAILSSAKLLLSDIRHLRFSSFILVLLTLVFVIPVWNRYVAVSNLPSGLIFSDAIVNSYWLIGPLFYYFILHSTQRLEVSWRNMSHALPYLLIAVFSTLKAFPVNFTLLLIVWNLMTSIYVVLSLKSLLQVRQKEQQQSIANQQFFHWGMALILGVLVFILADIIICAFLIFKVQVSHTIFVTFEFTRLLMILLLVCFFQFATFQFYEHSNDGGDKRNNTVSKGESRLSPAMATALQENLEQTMAESSLFKDADLSLTKLSESLQVSSHYLSELLNSHMQISFYDYINGLRIDDAKKQLLATPDQAIVDIAVNCGFNSKSTFYNCFKKYCGVTPTKYRSQAVEKMIV